MRNMDKLKDSKLTTITNLFTIIGVIVAVSVLFFAWNAVNQSQTLLDETRNLVNKSNAQLDTLNKAVTEIAHQTIMEAYNNESPHHVGLSCDYNDSRYEIDFRPKILYGDSTPSTVKFLVVTNLSFYTIDKHDIRHTYVSIGDTNISHLAVLSGPSDLKILKVKLKSVLEWADEYEEPNFYVRSSYEFLPYSDAKETRLTDFIEDETGHLLIGLTKDIETGNWIKIESNENIVCE